MLDRTPPAFFKQGTTAFTKLLVFAGLSVLLMMADLRWTLGQPIRNAMATTLYPVQWVLRQPVMGAQWLGDYLQSLDKAIARNEQLTEQLLDQAATVQQVDYLKLETQRLQNFSTCTTALPTWARPRAWSPKHQTPTPSA